MKTSTKFGLVGIGLTVLLFAGYLLFVSAIPTSGDHDRVNSFARDLMDRYPFPHQRKDGEGPAVYTTPNAFADYIHVYGRYSNREIADIESIARQLQSRRVDRKKVVLIFRAQELEQEHYREIVIE